MGAWSELAQGVRVVLGLVVGFAGIEVVLAIVWFTADPVACPAGLALDCRAPFGDTMIGFAAFLQNQAAPPAVGAALGAVGVWIVGDN